MKYSNFIVFAGSNFTIADNSLTEKEKMNAIEVLKKKDIDRKIQRIEFLHTMEAYYVRKRVDSDGNIWGDIIKIPGETKDTFINICIYRRPGNLPSFGLKERGSLPKLRLLPPILPNPLQSRNVSNKKSFEPVRARIGGRTKKRRSNRRVTHKKRRT